MSSPQSNAFHQDAIKCATCSKPLKFDELEAHVCPGPSSPVSPLTPTPSRTPTPLDSSRVVSTSSLHEFHSRRPQTPTPRAVSPLAITRPPRSPSPISTPHIPQTPPLPLKRSATENVTNGAGQRNPGAARGSRPPDEIIPPGSFRRSTTAPTRHPGRGDSTVRPWPVESFISQSGSIQFDYGSGSGGRDSAVPTLSIHVPDTETGGQAGRAGVGRRAFAAVAQAALLASSYGYHHQQPPPSPISPLHSQHFPNGILSPYLDPTGRGASFNSLLCSYRIRVARTSVMSRLTRTKQVHPPFQFHARRRLPEYRKCERRHLESVLTLVLRVAPFMLDQA